MKGRVAKAADAVIYGAIALTVAGGLIVTDSVQLIAVAMTLSSTAASAACVIYAVCQLAKHRQEA